MKFKDLYSIAFLELKTLFDPLEADFRLEEAEYNKSSEIWNIVVSYLVPKPQPIKTPAYLSLAPVFEHERVYKRLKIDNEGTVIGFYIYEKNDSN